MCPLNIRLWPPPEPSRIPSTFARPCSTCCHCTRRPISLNVSAISVAISCSDPVKLGVAIARPAHSTSRFRSILTFIGDPAGAIAVPLGCENQARQGRSPRSCLQHGRGRGRRIAPRYRAREVRRMVPVGSPKLREDALAEEPDLLVPV